MNTQQITVLNFTEAQLQNPFAQALEKVLSNPQIFKDSKTGNEAVWLSRIDAAKHLGICLPTLDKLTKEGKVTANRLGRKKLYALQELNKSIENLKIKIK